MNLLLFADFAERLPHHIRFRMRILDRHRHASVFSSADSPTGIQRIYVINLDRNPERWHRLHRELDRFRRRDGQPLSSIARRIAAIDARYMDSTLFDGAIIPSFTLAEQLSVDPNPRLQINHEAHTHRILMTRQEIAIALSHIELWKGIANGDDANVLVLEDDIYMPAGFVRSLEATWSELETDELGNFNFDLLYLSFKEVGVPSPARSKQPLRRPRGGIWQASGYVLTREGARKLLDLLPVHGPIDLWLNLQFPNLKVFTTSRPIIEQRVNEPSTNSYSILPVLSQLGVITHEKRLVPASKALKTPVIAFGSAGTGLTALAKALSMIGYTCCSDLEELPPSEFRELIAGNLYRRFNAYVNIGSLDGSVLEAIAESNPSAYFIATSDSGKSPAVSNGRLLHLNASSRDKWSVLCTFLGMEYPTFPYPNEVDIGLRSIVADNAVHRSDSETDLKFDRSPWVIDRSRANWNGIAVKREKVVHGVECSVNLVSEQNLDHSQWDLRNDTFPSNLSVFTPKNFVVVPGEHAELVFQEERTLVRDFTSAAIASKNSYLYGTFKTQLRASGVSGIITGVFLHRNAPRQEIDIELLGKDSTKMLVNVFYNPGPEGTSLEYGYRGTPTMIDLGFDAASDFHIYEIDWQPNMIRWRVDGSVVHQRLIWDPTPLPDRPMEFNVNVWHSRSKEFAGRLAAERIPTSVQLKTIEIRSNIPTNQRKLHSGSHRPISDLSSVLGP
jgi:GR25 family glycosyltransferase involved in LPS biosynthesis